MKSDVRAKRSRAPLATYCQKDETLTIVRPVLKDWMSRMPSTVPPISPTPPAKETPPSTTAVMASNSRLTLAAGCPAFILAAKMMPPKEVSTPIMIKQVVMILFGLRPARRAASVLPPIAYTLLPKRVFARMKPKITRQMIITQTDTGMPIRRTLPMLLNAWLLMETGLPSQMMYAAPRTIICVTSVAMNASILIKLTIQELKSPTSAPTHRVIRIATGIGRPA